MNQMEIFKNPEFGSIRTFEQDDKVLFCGTDIAAALGYTNPRKAVRDHTRGGTKRSIGVQTGKKADGTPAVQMVEKLGKKCVCLWLLENSVVCLPVRMG